MTIEYAPQGLYGVLTPQANTTVEPELAILTPIGCAWINGRLTSAKPTMEQRLVDYYDSLGDSLTQFANAPLKAIAVACTGASYLCGRDREDALVEAWSGRAGAPVITAARSVVAALTALGAKRVGLASPYPESLNRASAAYWMSRGFEVAATASAFVESSSFHPIYSLRGGAALKAVDDLRATDVDAIVMLGTGMPTLKAILTRNAAGGPPVLSCMLAMTWATVSVVQGETADRTSLGAWMTGKSWGGLHRLP